MALLRARSESPALGFDAPLVDAGAARRRAEQDAILLANRIRLLRDEDAKTRKRIRETEQRTQEVLTVRRQKDEQRRSKEADEARRLAEQQDMRMRQFRERDDHIRKVEATQQSVLDRKTGAYKEVRQQREAIGEMVRQQQVEALEVARMQHDNVRKSLMAGAEIRARSEDIKHEQARGMVSERLRREEEERRIKLERIAKMEKEEADLLERLQRTQERHKMAYRQLEDALAQPSASPTPCGGDVAHVRGSRSVEDFHARPAARPVSGGAGVVPTRALAPRPPRPRPSPHLGTSGTEANPERIAAASSPAALVASAPSVSKRVEACSSTCDLSTTTGRSVNSCVSTPTSVGGPIVYTTVDGAQLEIPTEDDLDLNALFAE